MGDSGRRSVVWWAVLGVAGCGVVATAHGIYEVARACGVGREVAALYVPITDGLALAAYSATTRLQRGRGYAWAVVIGAAGLSGLAQAVNLAGLGEPDWRLRAGVGAWPAIAVAVAAHLLWLAGRPRAGSTEEERDGQAREPGEEHRADHPGAPGDGAAAKPAQEVADPLLLAARAVAAHLGDRLSRRTLIHGLRERGHKVSTDRAAELLTRLRDAA